MFLDDIREHNEGYKFFNYFYFKMSRKIQDGRRKHEIMDFFLIDLMHLIFKIELCKSTFFLER